MEEKLTAKEYFDQIKEMKKENALLPRNKKGIMYIIYIVLILMTSPFQKCCRK